MKEVQTRAEGVFDCIKQAIENEEFVTFWQEAT